MAQIEPGFDRMSIKGRSSVGGSNPRPRAHKVSRTRQAVVVGVRNWYLAGVWIFTLSSQEFQLDPQCWLVTSQRICR
jgi:hypothetical protein